MVNILLRRFAELDGQLTDVEKSTFSEISPLTQSSAEYVDDNLLLNWRVKAKNLLARACGEESTHYKHFEKAERAGGYETNLAVFRRVRAVFAAAKEDFEGGYLSSVRNLVQAEVFDSELEQASALLESGYLGPAAVVAGVVLETVLRELCFRHSIAPSKIDRMNADLAKKGVYNVLVQKRVTTMAHVRNAAAHGNVSEYHATDVTSMVADVRRFVAEHLPS